MDKYELLVILNMPFVLYGLVRAWSMAKKGIIRRFGFVLRLVFWLVVASGLFFTRQIFAFLVQYHLTDSVPLSLADVVLTTGIIFCLFLIMRVYTKADMIEQRFDQLHEQLSIKLSNPK